MYNRLYEFVKKNEVLYGKQFGFQVVFFAEHAILELVNSISNSFENGKFTLGIFIDFSKAFDTVNYTILLNKLSQHRIKNNYYDWFKCHLNNRRQFIFYGEENTSLENIRCGIPQGSISRPLLFLIFVNDLQYTTNKLNPIIFADDTSFFPRIVT